MLTETCTVLNRRRSRILGSTPQKPGAGMFQYFALGVVFPAQEDFPERKQRWLILPERLTCAIISVKCYLVPAFQKFVISESKWKNTFTLISQKLFLQILCIYQEQRRCESFVPQTDLCYPSLCVLTPNFNNLWKSKIELVFVFIKSVRAPAIKCTHLSQITVSRRVVVSTQRILFVCVINVWAGGVGI